jgi:tetratricopeptide (TPR) repeat protein
MATAKKISRKELKEPDEFITFWARAVEFAQLHSLRIVIGVASVLVVLLLIWAGAAYSEKREAQAARLLAQAQALLQPTSPEDQQRQDDPQAKGRGLEILVDLVENYERTKACGVARILLGQGYYEQEKYDEAIAVYDAFLKKKEPVPKLTAMAWEGLAYSHEAKQDYRQAVICYEKLSQMALSNVHPWAYMGMARCYEKLGKPEKAIDAYRALLADHANHSKAPEAKASIARIAQSVDGTGFPQPEPSQERNPD